MNKIGVFLSTQEIRNIKDIYENAKISYKQLLEDVKYSISGKIASLIGAVFDKLDPTNTGIVPLQTLIDTYCAANHPHVLTRRKKPQTVQQQFVNGITRKAVDNNLTRQGLVDYYAQLNFCVPEEHEQYLVDLIKGTWKLVNVDEYVSPSRIHELQLILYEKVREKSDGRSNQWKCAKKAISYFDLGDEKLCNLQKFTRSLDKFGCNFKSHEIKALFNKYDQDQCGRLHYEEFSKMLMAIDINGMESKPNLLKTLGTNYFKITH